MCGTERCVVVDAPERKCPEAPRPLLTNVHIQADSSTNVWGINVPTKHAAWVELVVISLVTPNASFVGHLAGILAGVLYCRLPAVGWGLPAGGADDTGAPAYTYASGYASASSAGGATSGGSSSRHSSSNHHSNSRSPRHTNNSNSNSGSGSGSGSGSNNNSSGSGGGYSTRTAPAPSAPPVAAYQDGDELDVVWIDDIDVGEERTGAESSNVQSSNSGPDAAEVRRRRLERFGNR